MKWGNLIKVAFKSLIRNKMRSFLTMLGIIIGVGAVIALVSIGNGAQVQIQQQIASLGTNLLMVMPSSMRVGGISQGAGTRTSITLDDVEVLAKKASLIQGVSPTIRGSGQVVAGAQNWSTSYEGVSHTYLTIRNWTLAQGTFFTERDIKTRAKVAVLGKTVADELFPGQNPIGAKIRVGNIPMKVIGVLSERGQSANGSDQDDTMLIPSTTAYYRFGRLRHPMSLTISVISEDQMEAAEEQIRQILRQEHDLESGQDDDFVIRSQTDIVETATSVTGMLTLLLGSIAGVSLVVGGIGIMNIMLVSVTERTREIGIRLAIGARGSDVLTQFLIEAVILSLFGGIIGIASGIGSGYGIGRLINMPISVDPLIIVVAFLFSGAVGVFFGFYPARKAAALDPIVALRYE
ncbi:putative macrolipide-specific ABC-type efflux carrier, MacA conjunction protein [Candidatus Vecturithrix granuli]|uniref:Putative macrolipide-specific ABC-type efflux carrier, MacA conjunction protein n=1 Tax=Vecturithrix granuli TaxID=1499967 RepID=A0A081BV26_VECG1|nr:putative macrolipide-specific ABC-type efflux carrier, MacA conjunction protein [Candidatus Vecturithrix granuli]